MLALLLLVIPKKWRAVVAAVTKKKKRGSVGRSRTILLLVVVSITIPFFVKAKDAIADKLFQGNPALGALFAFREGLFDDLLLG